MTRPPSGQGAGRTWRPRDPVHREVYEIMKRARLLSPAGLRSFEREVERMLDAARRGVTPDEWEKGKR